VIDVSTRRSEDERRSDGGTERTEPRGTDTIESYETDGRIVFYDAENPLAWVETSRTLRLDELA